jgi:hypothetical protein
MATSDAAGKKPFWLAIEENILGLEPQALSGGNQEAAVQRIAGELDNAGYNVSRHGGNMIELRFALKDAGNVGRPFMEDFNSAIAALTLEDATDAYAATTKLINELGETWPKLKKSERRPIVIQFVEKARLDLLVATAKEMPDDKGIRYLIAQAVTDKDITNALNISDEKLKAVHAAIAAERAERARVAGLLEKVEGKSDAEKVKHLFENDVSEELIMEMAQVDQTAIDGAKKLMEEELKEKQRLAEEEAARKKAAAEGPALEDISPEDMLDFIESIREIMEFSDQEKEIRVMCEQSAIPKSLVDIAVSEPEKLDELEKKAEG